ncbi:MAG: hypothetical protein RMY29_023310 [Nostoc sp. CreGUA01]|nr:hypothetical protein [Nostoc sp. CreGUA01]
MATSWKWGIGHWAWKEDGGIRGWGDGGKEELLSPSSPHLPISPSPSSPSSPSSLSSPSSPPSPSSPSSPHADM